eukprot:TRINITY_DN3760_c0_g1_i2.p1 TRINITY_DN3760_c0_g1~~TRINITY_DN3760_c0_g1_i2.p1  ORF type:complete len:208 (+),score=73.74 TRINITY_DN3760_c0_g1_i2:506-1129(+)
MRVAQILTGTSNSPTDRNNLVTLLFSEVIEKKPNTTINKEELDCFLRRFGPIEQVVDKMSDLISSGANDWYHGNISRIAAENILNEFLKSNSSAFLIRASNRGQNVVFVVSFVSPPSPKIFHTQIFSVKNRLITVIQKENQQKEEVLSSVIGVLDFLVPRPQFAVPSGYVRFLSSSDLLSPTPIDNYLVPNEIKDLTRDMSSVKLSK